MEQWQSLLERFLRNECTGRENKIVYYALRDGLIDDEFRCAVDNFLNDRDTIAYIDGMEAVSDEALKGIRCGLTNKGQKRNDELQVLKSASKRNDEQKLQGAKSASKRGVLTEWLKIAAAVIVTLSVSWVAFHTKTADEQPLAMNTIRVPAGQTVNLTLSDGTNIWLNARTTLKYPSVFTGNRREIILDGEGYFDVAHDARKPFTVHAGGYDILALGTQFNVEAYSQENGFIGSLFDGSVRITSKADTSQTVVLLPNTMAQLHEGRLATETITDFSHYRWREGLISFRDIPFFDLMRKFEKCYGIKIVVQNNRVKNYAPTGKFRHADGIDYALRVLQRDFRFRFERDEENNTIYIK